MDIDLKARLLMGLDINVHGITIKNHKLGTIFKDIGLTRYLQMSNLATRSPKDFLNKEYISEFKDISMFDIFCMSTDLNGVFIQFLNLFTGYEWTFISTEAFVEFHATNENGSRVHISRDNFDEVIEVVKVMYCLSDDANRKKDEIDIDMAVDDEVRELAMEFAEFKKQKNKNKSNVTITSIISFLASKVYDWGKVFDMTIYQIIKSYSHFEMYSYWENVMTGIYQGTIDSKSINFDEIHYARETDV